MAYRYFPRRTQQQLEAELDNLDNEEMSGGSIISVSAGDTSNTTQLQQGFGTRRRKIMWDLSVLDPEQYPYGSVGSWDRTQFRVRQGWS